MAISRYNSSVLNSSSNSVSGSFDVGSGTNRGLVALVLSDSNSSPTASYNSASLSRSLSYPDGLGNYFHVFSIPNPTSGSNTFSFSTSSGSLVCAHLHAYNGVDQTTVIDATSGNVNSGTTVNLSVTTLVDNSWTVSAARNAGGGLFGASYTSGTQTIIHNNFYNGYYQSMSGDSNSSVGTAGSKTVTANPNGSTSIIWGVICSIKPSSSGASANSGFFALM